MLNNKIEKVKNLLEIAVDLLEKEIVQQNLRLDKAENEYKTFEKYFLEFENKINDNSSDDEVAKYEQLCIRNNLEVDCLGIIRNNIGDYCKAIKELNKIKSNYIGD